MNKIFVIIFTLLFMTFMSSPVYAQEGTAVPTSFNSFEVFWPITAGKTMGESLYALKNFKETLRGLIIFGNPQKADYNVFLSVKRAVETEKLLTDGKNELAAQTLDKMSKHLDVAEKAAASATSMPAETAGNINQRLDNLQLFLVYLSSKNEPVKDKLQTVLTDVSDLNQKI